MTDIEIARSTRLEEIEAVASKYGIPEKELEHYGHYMAKVPTRLIDEERVKKSNLILVTAIRPQSPSAWHSDSTVLAKRPFVHCASRRSDLFLV